MNMRLASGVCALFCGVIVLICGATASAAGECDANTPATAPAAGSYTHPDLPILVILHRAGSTGAEKPTISIICLGQNPYTPPPATDLGPNDLDIDAAKVTVKFRLGPDLKITRWRASGSRADQGGIRMVPEPKGSGSAKPGSETDWPACAGKVTTANDIDIWFDFSACTRELFYKYELDFQCKPNTTCKNIPPIDPQIVNRPHSRKPNR